MNNSVTTRIANQVDLDSILELYISSANPSWTNFSAKTLREGIQKLLSCSAKGFQVVAEAEGQIVGIVRVSPEWSPYREATFWWLENVYVVPEWRRRGVYTKMHLLILEAARKDESICGVRLHTDYDNIPARRTYEKAGMWGRMTEQFEIDFVFGPEKKS